jgi:hypothetical protein
MNSLVEKIKAEYGGDLDIEVVDESLCFRHPSTEIEISLSKDSLEEAGSEDEIVANIGTFVN